MEALGQDRWGRRQDNRNGHSQPGNRRAENHEAGWGVVDAGDAAWGTLGAVAGATSGAGATAAEGAKDCEAALGAGAAADSGSWGSRVSPRCSETGGAAAEGAAAGGAGAEDVGVGATAGSGDLRAAGA